MDITEFKLQLRELLAQTHAPDMPEDDKVFWARAAMLLERVIDMHVDSQPTAEVDDEVALTPEQVAYRELSVTEHDQLERTRRTKIAQRASDVQGWSLRHDWDNDQLGAIKVYVNDGVIQAALPKIYRTAIEQRLANDVVSNGTP